MGGHFGFLPLILSLLLHHYTCSSLAALHNSLLSTPAHYLTDERLHNLKMMDWNPTTSLKHKRDDEKGDDGKGDESKRPKNTQAVILVIEGLEIQCEHILQKVESRLSELGREYSTAFTGSVADHLPALLEVRNGVQVDLKHKEWIELDSKLDTMEDKIEKLKSLPLVQSTKRLSHARIVLRQMQLEVETIYFAQHVTKDCSKRVRKWSESNAHAQEVLDHDIDECEEKLATVKIKFEKFLTKIPSNVKISLDVDIRDLHEYVAVDEVDVQKKLNELRGRMLLD